MTDSRRGRRKRLGPLLLISCLSAGMLGPVYPALGFSNIQISSSSSQTTNFALYNTVAGSNGSPTWSGGNGGMLISSGSSLFPVLTTINGISQNYSASNMGAFTSVQSANVPPLPASFGAATVSASAATNLKNDGTDLSQQIGVSFNSGTFLQSAATMAAGTAAVSFTALHASFLNSSSPPPTAGNYTGTAGSVISATGNLSHTAGSFVELANTGTITINGVATNFAIIVGFAYDKNLNESTFVYGTGTTTLSAPDPTTGAFSIKDVNNFGSVTVPKGASFSVDSQLTLISDPGSMIQLSDLTDLPGPIPTIGSFAGGPAIPAVIPEPLALVQFGTSILVLTALMVRRRCRRTRLTSPRLPGLSRVVLATLATVLLALGSPGMSEAGTIWVNDLSQPLSTSSTGFSGSTVSLDSVNQTATFDGTYLSAGGFPAAGQSATYWVVFQEPDGSQSAATELIITGLTPTTTENTSVHMFFEGLVTTPINPGPGVFSIPEPEGFFDVAAFLVSQGAPDVPDDLSVLIATVPEPASLVMGGLGVLAGSWVVIRRRRVA